MQARMSRTWRRIWDAAQLVGLTVCWVLLLLFDRQFSRAMSEYDEGREF